MSLDNVLPMSLERSVTYVPDRFIREENAGQRARRATGGRGPGDEQEKGEHHQNDNEDEDDAEEREGDE